MKRLFTLLKISLICASLTLPSAAFANKDAHGTSDKSGMEEGSGTSATGHDYDKDKKGYDKDKDYDKDKKSKHGSVEEGSDSKQDAKSTSHKPKEEGSGSKN